MALKKGDKLNPFGRPSGSKNLATAEVRKAFQKLIENNLDSMQKDLDSLEAKDRLLLLLKVSEFVLPKLSSMDITSQLEMEYKHLESLLMKGTPEAIEAISTKILTLKILKENENE